MAVDQAFQWIPELLQELTQPVGRQYVAAGDGDGEVPQFPIGGPPEPKSADFESQTDLSITPIFPDQVTAFEI